MDWFTSTLYLIGWPFLTKPSYMFGVKRKRCDKLDRNEK